MISLRPYQQQCLRAIPETGSYLIQMATGLGKTVTFAHLPRRGRMLILSHREELVRQPLKYFDCPTDVEMAAARASSLAEVVSASVPSITRRLNRFAPDEFDIIVCDEAHHAAAQSYRRIFDHFHPRLLLGFTATPSRGDKVRLDNVFEDIVFSRDLRWGIENGYLSDIFCRRTNIGYDLSAVRIRNGDYAPGELDEAMDGTSDAIAEAYRDLAVGATLIFAASVHQAEEIAARIPDAVAVTGETKDRASIIRAFSDRKILCLVNCMVFTEGTDMPLIETVIIARPTKSETLYTQMVGRGLRIHPEKERLNLIDCVGVSEHASLCTAPTLLGVDMDNVPVAKAKEIEGPLFELPGRIAAASDCPQSWIRNVEVVNLWAKGQRYATHDVNWFRMPDGSLALSLPSRRMVIPPMDELGRVRTVAGELVPMQEAFDRAYRWLEQYEAESRALWDLNSVKRWGRGPASEKQLAIINRRFPEFGADNLTKGQAAMIMNRITANWRRSA